MTRHIRDRFVLTPQKAPTQGTPLWSLRDLAEHIGVTVAGLRKIVRTHPQFFPQATAITHRGAGKSVVPRYRKDEFLAGYSRYVKEGPGKGPRTHTQSESP